MTTIELTRIRPPPLNPVRFFTEEPTASASNDINDIFPSPQILEEQDESSAIYPPWKRHLYQLLEQPTSSTAAFVMHMFTTSLIVVSAFVTVLETVPAVHSISTRIWFGVETSVVALFTVEYIARLLAWSNTWSTLFHWVFCAFVLVSCVPHTNISSGTSIAFYGVIDLLSVLPYYIELILLQDTVTPFLLYFKLFTEVFCSPFISDFLYYVCSACCAYSGHFAITTPFCCMFSFFFFLTASKIIKTFSRK